MLKIPRVLSSFADFTIGMIGNETGHLLKRQKLYRKFININETYYVLRRNIDVTSLKSSCRNLYKVNSYDATNMKVFALSLWGKFSWGLAYYDEFTKCILFPFNNFIIGFFIDNMFVCLFFSFH